MRINHVPAATWWLHDPGNKKAPPGWSEAKLLIYLAERVGFEPTVPCGTPDFESEVTSVGIR